MLFQLNRGRSGRVSGLLIALLFSAFVLPRLSLGQEQGTSQEQPSSPKPDQTSAQTAAPKKPKKVWTNEDMRGVKTDAVSEVGQAQSSSNGRNGARSPQVPSTQVAAAYRKQLNTLQAQQASVEKQIEDLKNFNRGESGHDTGLQLHKRYSTEPIEDQIRKLEAKHKLIADRIDAVLDAARRKGIEPGQLR